MTIEKRDSVNGYWLKRLLVCIFTGGESVLVNGAVFKTVSETVRTGSGRFDSYTPPPEKQ
jgi:hypothetical protein